MQENTVGTQVDIPVSSIIAGNNDRKFFQDGALQALAASIAKDGLMTRPIVRALPGGMYQIVAGERRTRAMRDVLGWQAIPVDIRVLGDEAASAMMLLENTAREDLNAIEEANAYSTRIDAFSWSEERVAEAAGVTVGHVRSRMSLLSLSAEIQELVARDVFKPDFAALLCDLDANRQHFAMTVWRDKPTMNLTCWRRVVAEYRAEQASESQMDFLQLAAMTETIKARPDATKGKNAPTGGWRGQGAPAPRMRTKDNISASLLRYAHDLQLCEAAGAQVSAADAVMNMYNALVFKAYVNVTADVPTCAGDPTAEDLAQIDYI